MRTSLVSAVVLALIYMISILGCLFFRQHVRLVGLENEYRFDRPIDTFVSISIAVFGLSLLPFFFFIGTRKRQGGLELGQSFNFPNIPKLPLVLMNLACSFGIGIFLIDYGLLDLVVRDAYILQHDRVSAVSAIGIVLLFIPFVSGLTVSSTESGFPLKIFSLMQFSVFVLIQLCQASRKLAFSLLLFLIARLLVNKCRLLSFESVVVIAFAVMTNAIVLELRGLDKHGLYPYCEFIFFDAYDSLDYEEILSSNISSLADPLTVLDATIATYSDPQPIELAVSVSPLPSFVHSWGELAPSLRLHEWVPYSGIGELYCHGPLIEFLYFFCLSLILILTELNVDRHTDSIAPKSILLIFAIAFSVYVPMYNLRSATRLIYYGVFLSFIVSWFLLIRQGKSEAGIIETHVER